MRTFLISVLAAVAILVVPSVVVTYWYTHSHEIYRASLAAIRASPVAREALGEDIRPGLWVQLKTSIKQRSGSAEYRVMGTRGEAEAIVSARRRDEGWTLHYIWLKPERGKIVVVLDNR